MVHSNSGTLISTRRLYLPPPRPKSLSKLRRCSHHFRMPYKYSALLFSEVIHRYRRHTSSFVPTKSTGPVRCHPAALTNFYRRQTRTNLITAQAAPANSTSPNHTFSSCSPLLPTRSTARDVLILYPRIIRIQKLCTISFVVVHVVSLTSRCTVAN